MKIKLIGTLLLTYGLILFSGCQKTFSCGCTDGTQNIIHTEEIQADNSKKAKEHCESIGTECDLLWWLN